MFCLYWITGVNGKIEKRIGKRKKLMIKRERNNSIDYSDKNNNDRDNNDLNSN